jgi:hypothetical protein
VPPQAAQVPGIPVVEFRPVQAKPEPLQVPAKLLPQQDWPSAPQAPHSLPEAPSRQPREPVQAATPPSVGKSPFPLEQQG